MPRHAAPSTKRFNATAMLPPLPLPLTRLCHTTKTRHACNHTVTCTSSRAKIFTEWLDPAPLDENDPSKRDVALDLWDPRNPNKRVRPCNASKPAHALSAYLTAASLAVLARSTLLDSAEQLSALTSRRALPRSLLKPAAGATHTHSCNRATFRGRAAWQDVCGSQSSPRLLASQAALHGRVHDALQGGSSGSEPPHHGVGTPTPSYIVELRPSDFVLCERVQELQLFIYE